ncbi:hypothetical protein C8J57DRAFT_1328246 [Mycena rebaudengoi]|nr:hypothetical protein C8J57DRAFT_1328246 [Mycena rebaudengoi]
MKFTILACALMAVTSVAARPTPNQYASRSTPSSTRREDNRSTSSSVTRTSSGSEPTRSNSNNNGNNNNNDNDREDDEDRNDNDRNDNNNNDRNRECKQQDIALASALGTSVVIGLGQQAAAEELLDNSNNNNNNNFNDKLDTLKQFVEAQATQVRTAATLIEDNNSAQNQVRELIDALDDQVDIINRLRNSNDDRQEIERLIDSFKDTTNLAQDGQAEALADCSIQLHVLV